MCAPPSRRGFFRFGELWRYFRPARWLILLAVGLNLICGLVITAQNALPKFLTDNIVLSDHPSGQKFREATGLMAAFVCITLFGRILCWHLSMRIFARSSTQAMTSICTLFFHHVNFLCLRFHEQKQSGELFSYLFGSPLVGLQQFLSQFILLLPFTVLTLLSTLILVTTWNPLMAAIFFAALVLNGWVALGATSWIKQMHHSFQHLESSVSDRVAELLRGQKAMKMLGAESLVVEKF